MLHLINKQAYKLELPKKQRVYNMFYVSLLEQNTIKNERVDENVTKLEFDAGDKEKYKVKAIRDSAIYVKKSEGHLPSFYYVVAWKGYPEEENT